MPGALDPHKTVFHRPPPGYPSCYNTEPSDIIWNTIDDCTGYLIWKYCTYDSRIDYRIPGGGNYMIQDWSNPDPGTSPLFLGDFLNRYYNWKKDLVPWPLNITRWHNNQFVPLHCLIQLRTEPCGSQKFGGPLLSLLPFPYSIQIAILLILF